MKIDITRGEKKAGLIFKKIYPTVTVTVQFTEEEKQIIKLTKTEGNIICERPVRAGMKPVPDRPDIWHLRVLSVLDGKPNEYEFENIAEANSYYDALVPSLKNMKGFLEDNARERSNVSIEL